MEKINRDNFEAYVLDYLEGNLCAEDTQDLFAFLEVNPDLKSLLEVDLTDAVLTAAPVEMSNKSKLKVLDDSTLSLNSADHWMLESVEGNLSASKQMELEEFVRLHQLEKTYQAYHATRLKPDLNEVFGNRKKLKVATGFVIPLYARVASVAAAGVLLFSLFYNADQPVAQRGVAMASATDARYGNYEVIESVQTPNETQLFAQDPVKNSVKKVIIRNENPQQNESLVVVVPKDSVNPGSVFEDQINNLPQDEIVKTEIDTAKGGLKTNPSDADDVVIRPFNYEARPTLVTEEPYRVVTNAASDFTKREVSFTREKNTQTNEYVSYSFQIGKFEFERKKSN